MAAIFKANGGTSIVGTVDSRILCADECLLRLRRDGPTVDVYGTTTCTPIGNGNYYLYYFW